MPSISEDGRYVSFTTDEGASLPEISHARPDFRAHGEAGQRLPARHGQPAGRHSAPKKPDGRRANAPSSRPRCARGSEDTAAAMPAGEHAGSYAVGRTAMSADGNEVAFVTDGVSDLVAYPALEEEERAHGETPAPHTPVGPGGGAPVRHAASPNWSAAAASNADRAPPRAPPNRSSSRKPPNRKPVGAVALGRGRIPRLRAGSAAWPGASISADGTTVAWARRKTSRSRPRAPRMNTSKPNYQEPLWEKLPAQANQTRRVTGGSDPEAPGCAASGVLELPQTETVDAASDPCQGPFLREHASVSEPGGGLQGRAGGHRRASAATAKRSCSTPTRGSSPRASTSIGTSKRAIPTDLFVVNMATGLTRTQALTPLTEAGETSEAAIRRSHRPRNLRRRTQVAFSTVRTLFALGLADAGQRPALPEVGIGELYDADLANGTLTRVTHGYEGEGEQSQQPHTRSSSGRRPVRQPRSRRTRRADAGASPRRGEQLVFTSTAANLVYGDGNSPAYAGQLLSGRATAATCSR